jgi:hypothetical protein
MAGPLTLPEEFALLSLADTGKTIDPGQAKGGCAVAELGELALRGELLLRQRVHTVFGWNAIRRITHVIELVDPTPAGLAWADELLAELANEPEAVSPAKLLWRRHRRRKAFHRHRDALVAHGPVRYVPSRGLFRRARYLPDPTVRFGPQFAVQQAVQEHHVHVPTTVLGNPQVLGQLAADHHVGQELRVHLQPASPTGVMENQRW